MKLAIDIVQSLLLPKLEKDASFDINQTNIAFWETFTTALLDFEKDAKPVYAAIYSLELKDAEKIISKLDTVYICLIKELAENHVLGISTEANDYLIKSKNSAFEKEVNYFNDLENAIKKVERKRIKTELPKAFDKLSFSLSNDVIALAIKKKEREALKEKMNAWDVELSISEETPVYSISPKKSTKFISFYFTKYAATVCIYLSVSIQYYNLPYYSIDSFVQTENGEEKVKGKPDTNSNSSISSEALAEVTTFTKNTHVIESGRGFVPNNNNIKIVENNQKARIESIVKAIEKYRQMLEKNFKDNKVGYRNRSKEIKMTVDRLQNELYLLNQNERFYEFDGKLLVLYVSNTAKENTIVLYGDNFYLKRDADYFKLTVAEKPQLYKKESNTEIQSTLDKIIFDYGN